MRVKVYLIPSYIKTSMSVLCGGYYQQQSQVPYNSSQLLNYNLNYLQQTPTAQFNIAPMQLQYTQPNSHLTKTQPTFYINVQNGITLQINPTPYPCLTQMQPNSAINNAQIYEFPSTSYQSRHLLNSNPILPMNEHDPQASITNELLNMDAENYPINQDPEKEVIKLKGFQEVRRRKNKRGLATPDTERQVKPKFSPSQNGFQPLVTIDDTNKNLTEAN
ncbi:hypothetical protein FQA39_LY03659 [Lamprigera yunnana]|nr:hypothetical protein FQA39_LY03659 [Lamprigera yunnana]